MASLYLPPLSRNSIILYESHLSGTDKFNLSCSSQPNLEKVSIILLTKPHQDLIIN